MTVTLSAEDVFAAATEAETSSLFSMMTTFIFAP